MIDKEVRTHSKKESGIEKKGKGREDFRERRREGSVEDVGQRAAHLPSCNWRWLRIARQRGEKIGSPRAQSKL